MPFCSNKEKQSGVQFLTVLFLFSISKKQNPVRNNLAGFCFLKIVL